MLRNLTLALGLCLVFASAQDDSKFLKNGNQLSTPNPCLFFNEVAAFDFKGLKSDHDYELQDH